MARRAISELLFIRAAAEPVEGEEKLEPEVIKEKKEVPSEGAGEDKKEKEKEK